MKTEEHDPNQNPGFDPASGYDPQLFPHRDITEVVIGAFFDVYNELGFGFLESVYQKALVLVLRERGLRADAEAKMPVYFRGHPVGTFEADVVVEGKVILELKAAEGLVPEFEAQLLNYLKASDIEVGLLLNFGPKPRLKRFAFFNTRKRSRPPVVFE